MTIKPGDWVKYKHKSGMHIIGLIEKKEKDGFLVRDWLGAEHVSRKCILEVRPATQEADHD